MHEFDIIDKILKLITDEAGKQGFARIREAHLKVGRMNGLEKVHFDTVLSSNKEEKLKDMRLDVEEIPVQLFCNGCGNCYTDPRFDDPNFAHTTSHAPDLYIAPPCPECGSPRTRLVYGKELTLVSIDGE
jgi:Zn finger protein HypA/HybF involved in hydrogenase expression